MEGAEKKEGGQELGERVSAPGEGGCHDNSQQQYFLRRAQRHYLGEQKSANTCLGGRL